MLRHLFKKAFLQSRVYGPQQTALCDFLYSRAIHKLDKRSGTLNSFSAYGAPSLERKEPEANTSGANNEVVADSKTDVKDEVPSKTSKKPIRPHTKKDTKVKVNPMEQDLSKHRRLRLHTLVSLHKERYLVELLDSDCNDPSAEALTKERKAFYELFGAKPSEQEALAKLIAKDIDAHTKVSADIINGLVNYLKDLSVFLQSRKTKLEKSSPKLLEKYIKFGVHEVYRLIKSISVKVTTAGHSIIDPNGILFPQVLKSITDIFGTGLKTIEF